MSFQVDIPTTEDVLAAILSSSMPPLPPSEQHYGSTRVSWWETDPGEVYIHAEGGTADDRHYASTLVGIELQLHGYRRAQFDLDVDHLDPGRKTSAWPDLMAKAKRLIQSGQVQVLRNGYNYIVGHIIGDHGEYDTEISRDDPQSRSITGWQCTCPWDQYAWQRTRKWKKFEGRPCSHVMALYWKALSTPLDEQLTPEQAEAMGTGQKLPEQKAPAVPEHPPDIEERIQKGERPPEELPRSFSPEGEQIQGDQMQMNMPPDATGGPPGPAQAPLAPPPTGPAPPGVLPPFPGEQMQMQWGGPGTTPGGGVSPPGAYSVPGAKPPGTPANPIQRPGTYSSVEGPYRDEWQPGEQAHYEYHCHRGHDSDDRDLWYRSHQPVTILRREPTDLDDGPMMDEHGEIPGPYTPEQRMDAGMPYAYRVRWPDGHEKTAMEDELYTDPRYWDPNGGPPSLEEIRQYEPDFQPHIAASWDPLTCEQCGSPMSSPKQVGNRWMNHCTRCGLWREVPTSYPLLQDEIKANPPYPALLTEVGQDRPWVTSATFQPPQIVRLKNPMMGLAEGPEPGQYGDGEYREVPAGSTGEVLSQDQSTGWVEIIVPLDQSGYHEPFHVRCFVEPSDIEPTNQAPPGPFIRRHR